jgi:hypothetical protein
MIGDKSQFLRSVNALLGIVMVFSIPVEKNTAFGLFTSPSQEKIYLQDGRKEEITTLGNKFNQIL